MIPGGEEFLREQFVEPADPLSLLQVATVPGTGGLFGEPAAMQRLPDPVKEAGQEIRTLLVKQGVAPLFLRFVEAPVCQIAPYHPVTHPMGPHYLDR